MMSTNETPPARYDGLPDVMSPKTLADYLEMHANSLERWRAAGIGPAWFKFPGSTLVRYSRADVIEWLEACRVEP